MKKIVATVLTLAFLAVSCDTKKVDQKVSNEIKELKDTLNTTKDTVYVHNEKFSENTLNKEFEDTQNNKITFKEILAKHKGAPILIDVWASCCPDCIKGFPELQNVQQKYPKTAFVFLSLDKTKDKWKEAIKKYNLVGNHYYLNEKMGDEFGKSIKLDWIPRYILVDAEGNIAQQKAIIANDTLLIKNLDKLQP